METNTNSPALQPASPSSMTTSATSPLTSLASLTSLQQQGAIRLVLQGSELARTNNFDLMQEQGWVALTQDLSEDFPYLNLLELRGIIKMGCKGKLDKYKSSPLNYTRIYQWVEQRAPYCLSYWQHRFPEATAWALHTLGEAGLLELLAERDDLLRLKQSMYHDLIKRRTEKAHRLQDGAGGYPDAAAQERQQALAVTFHQQWAAQYPAYYKQFHYQLFS